MYKVERVIHPTTWIRELKIGEIRIANVSLEQKHSFRNLISKYNQSQGILAGKFIHPKSVIRDSFLLFLMTAIRKFQSYLSDCQQFTIFTTQKKSYSYDA